MRHARPGAATMRAVAGSVVVSLLLAGAAAWWARGWLEARDRSAPIVIPERVEVPALPPAAAPPLPEPGQDPLERAWCDRGPVAVVEATEDMTQSAFNPSGSIQSMRQAWLRGEALFTLGRVDEALAWSRRLCASLERPSVAQLLEPLVLEQHARVRMAAGESDMEKLERGLRASIEARTMLGGEVPDLAWATLSALEKARGDCAAAVESGARALVGLDAPAWLRLKQRQPWRLALVALAAMDRADCLAARGRLDEARAAASSLAADLAVALGETDPLAQQAADLRDSLVGG